MQTAPVQMIKKLDREETASVKEDGLKSSRQSLPITRRDSIYGTVPSQACLPANGLGNSTKMGKSHLKLRFSAGEGKEEYQV